MTYSRCSVWLGAILLSLAVPAVPVQAQLAPDIEFGSVTDTSSPRYNHSWYYRCPTPPRVILRNSNFPNPPYAPFGDSDEEVLDAVIAGMEDFTWGDPEFASVSTRFPTTSDPLIQYELIAERLDDFTFLYDRMADAFEIDAALQRVADDAAALRTVLSAQKDLVELTQRAPDRQKIWSAHFKHKAPTILPKPCEGPYGDRHGYKEGDEFIDALAWRNPLFSLANAFTDAPGHVLVYPTPSYIPETTSYGRVFEGFDNYQQPQYSSYTSKVTYTEIEDAALLSLDLEQLHTRLANALRALDRLTATVNRIQANSPGERTQTVLARRGIELGRLSIPLAARLNTHISEHRAQVANQQVEIDRLAMEVADRTAKYDAARSDIDTANVNYDNLEASLQVLQTELQATGDHIHELNNEMSALSLETYDNLPDAERAMALARRRVRMMDLRAEKRNAKANVERLRRERSALTLQLNRMVLDLSLLKTVLRDAVTVLRDKKIEMSKGNRDLATANSVIDDAQIALGKIEKFNSLPMISEGRRR